MANLKLFRDFTFIVGIDIAKEVFQVYCCNTETGECTNRQVTRDKLLKHFANRDKCLIGMEACGSSQYWARKLLELGHSVRIMDSKRVKPYVRGNKSDSADAEGIFNALLHGEPAVVVKGPTERDIHALTTMRTKMQDQRTANINHVRGLLAEYGQVIPKSVNQFLKRVDECINKLEGDAVQLVIDTMREIVAGIRVAIEKIAALDKEINRLAMQTKHAKNLLTIPGVGPVIMAHMCVLLADPTVFATARQFAAYQGLVPMHFGSGGKTINKGIPVRCNKRLRALLTEGAQAAARSRRRPEWMSKILARKPKKVALVAIANRIARQCWAVASKGQEWSITPIASAA